MSIAEFIYKGRSIIIQCNENEKLEGIITRFYLKVKENVGNMYFLYSSKIVDINSTFINLANSEDKKRNKISILVHDNEVQIDEPSLQKAKYIICPDCKENILMRIKDYKIEVYDCQNGHNIKNLSISEFEKTQYIDESKIICDKCKLRKKSETYNNSFFICVSCNKNLCPLCRSSHEKEHNIFDYEEKYFKCSLHSESYIFYCEQCKKNICIVCEKDHINHKKISLGEIIPDKNKIEEEKNNLRNKLDELQKEIQIIINKFNNVLKNLDIYYNIIDDLASGYDIRKRNFQILKNLNDISEYNNNIIKDLNQIINEKDINIKFKSIMNIYDKINNKEIKEMNEVKEPINDNNKNKNENETKTEIKNEEEENKSDFDKRLLKEIRKIQKIGHKFEGINSDFDFDSMKKINYFDINNKIDSVLILKDGRILCYQYKKGSKIYIYKLEGKNNVICDVYEVESGIRDIKELDDGNLLLTGGSNIKLYQLKDKEIVFIKEEKLKKMSKAHLYCLSD